MTPVIISHDAAIDEFMSVVLLTTLEDVDLKAIVITNADCIDDPAMQAQWKILQFLERTDIPIALSGARGYNAFPWAYRADCIKQGGIAALARYAANSDWPPYPCGEDLLTAQLRAAEPGSVDLLVTGPMTPLQSVLQDEPALAGRIRRVIWMGGAIEVAGNLDPATLPPEVANPYAEWNAFWDPFAVDWVFRNTEFPIVIFPLDVTNVAKVRKEFLADLLVQAKSSRYSNLARQSYAIVEAESFYDLWDVLTTCYIPRPDLFAPPREMKLEIVTTSDMQGALVPSAEGRECQVVLEVRDLPGFYAFVLERFATS